MTEAVLQGKINCQKSSSQNNNPNHSSANSPIHNSSNPTAGTKSGKSGKNSAGNSQNNQLLSSGYSGLPRITATNMTGTGTEGSGLLNAQVEIPDEKDARFCVLSYDQVKRLNDLMSEVINI